jgi:hypothetical protein
METLRKKLCVGLEKRPGWEAKITEVIEKVVTSLRLELDHEELARLAAIPRDVANLIYAGMLRSFVLEFAGEKCEVVLEYYPGEDEQDDLDMSLLEVVDWDAESLVVSIMVENAEYAESITGPALMTFSSSRLTVQVSEADEDESATEQEDPEEEDTGKEEEETQDDGKEED